MASEAETFTELVRSRPCLYDKKDKDYKGSRGVKAKNWCAITNGGQFPYMM